MFFIPFPSSVGKCNSFLSLLKEEIDYIFERLITRAFQTEYFKSVMTAISHSLLRFLLSCMWETIVFIWWWHFKYIMLDWYFKKIDVSGIKWDWKNILETFLCRTFDLNGVECWIWTWFKKFNKCMASTEILIYKWMLKDLNLVIFLSTFFT